MTHEVLVAEQPAATISTVASSTSVDTALTDVVVQTGETTTTVGVSPYIIIDQSGGGGDEDGGFGGSTELASASSVGATQVVVKNVPAELQAGLTFVAIDAYTTECELRALSSVSGNTLTFNAAVDNPLRFAHDVDANVAVITGQDVPVSMFGLRANGTDEWGPLQRLFRETALLGLVIESFGGPYKFGQPILITQSCRANRMWVGTTATFAPADVNGAAVFNATQGTFMTAVAATNTLATPGANGLVLTETVAFNAPYGETLPGGIVPGRIYYVVSTPTANTFTISETLGGATLDITSDGAGWGILGIQQLNRIHWESFRLDLNTANVNGFRLGMQQPSWTRNLRVEMLAPATVVGTTGFFLTGQQSYHDNISCNGNSNCIAMAISGTGHVIRGFNDNSAGANNDTGLTITGNWHSITDVWTEQPRRASIEILDNSKCIQISGNWLINTPTTVPALLVSGLQTSYEVGMMRSGSDTQLMVEDTARGISLTGPAEVDGGAVFNGLVQHYGAVAPVLKGRKARSINANFSSGYADEFLFVNSTGGTRTITLPTAVGWHGWTQTILNVGSNSVILDPTGSQTIAGAATLTLAQGESATVFADGSNFGVIGRMLPSALQTYAVTNATTDRAYDANATTIDEVADALGTLIADLRAKKLIL